jgi:arginyl-tRNA synthetase
MFEHELHQITTQILDTIAAAGIPAPGSIDWAPIPFSGTWGVATNFFRTAAAEARAGKAPKGVKVPQRAQQIAEMVAEALGTPEGFQKVEAVRGYLNLYFDPADYAQHVLAAAFRQQERFGTLPSRGERVLVEYSQPNTHKAFHVGHLRNVILGESVCAPLHAPRGIRIT